MTAAVAIDTRKVAKHRKLRFETIEDVLMEVDRLVAADQAGRLERLGNWTLGQILGHLATWAEFSFTGAPVKVPWFIRIFLKTRKNNFVNASMPMGVKIPRIEGGTLGIEPIGLDEGLSHYRAAMERLRRETPAVPNVVFGPLTHEEWIKLNLRHAELHLGFVRERD